LLTTVSNLEGAGASEVPASDLLELRREGIQRIGGTGLVEAKDFMMFLRYSAHVCLLRPSLIKKATAGQAEVFDGGCSGVAARISTGGDALLKGRMLKRRCLQGVVELCVNSIVPGQR